MSFCLISFPPITRPKRKNTSKHFVIARLSVALYPKSVIKLLRLHSLLIVFSPLSDHIINTDLTKAIRQTQTCRSCKIHLRHQGIPSVDTTAITKRKIRKTFYKSYGLPFLWALTDSNRRPSACKADALNQLS